MIGALGLIGGKYRLVRELGRGAFGAVYAARLEPSGEPVALKILARFDQGRSIERFRREVQVLSRLAPHPNIVRVFESGEHGGLPFVAMELVQGGSLAAALKDNRRPTVAQAAKIAEQVALGLDHLHRSGVVHRDVNANNVLIDEGGNVRLVDFGLALDQQRVTRITETGELLGTPLTFAPEQLDGKSDAIGPAADIYATAALLYELLTGRSPFQDSKSFRELAHRIRTELPPPADELNPQVPRALARAIELGLAKRAADRPRTAAELAKLIAQGFKAGGSRTSTNTNRAAILGDGPKQVGPYELLLPIGRGRRGIVYSARRRLESGEKREAALRVLAVAGDLAGAFAQYGRSVEVLKRVSHPNVVATFESGIEEGYGFCAFELARGETLRKVIDRDRKLEPRVALAIAAKVARGVAAVHAAGIFHGDLRAEEVLLDPEHGPKVSDFMLETVLSRSAVDVAEGRARDVQALGALLHEMLTGRRPGSAGVSSRREALDKQGDSLARAAAQVALKALDKQAQLRHADAAAFAGDCEHAGSGFLAFFLRVLSGERSVDRARVVLGAVAIALLAVAALATKGIVVARREATGNALLDRARAAVRAGARPEEVAGDVARGLSLLGADEARLLEAGRLLMAAGDRAGAARWFQEACGDGSLEALALEDATESKVEQCFEWAGDGRKKLVDRAAEAKACGGRPALLERIAETRLLVDRGTARAELLRSMAASFSPDAAAPIEVPAARALLLLEAGEVADAEGEATLALAAVDAEHDRNADRHDARATELLFLRARARAQLGRLDLAERDAKELLVLSPGHARGLALRAAIRARRGNSAGARADLAACTQTPSFKAPPAVLLLDCARASAALGDLLRGLEYLERAQDQEKRNPLIAIERASLDIRRGAWEDAANSLDRALSLEPARMDLLLLERARLRTRRQGRVEETVRADLERAIAANPRLVAAHLLLGDVEAKAGEPDLALGRFDEAARLAPWSSEPLRASALVQKQRGNLTAALATLDRAVSIEPDVAENRALRAEVRLARASDRDGATAAIEDLDVALGLDGAATSPLRASWLALRGMARLARNEPGRAIDDLSQAIEMGKEDAPVYAARAEARARSHEIDAAARDLERAIELERRAGGDRAAAYEKARRDLENRR